MAPSQGNPTGFLQRDTGHPLPRRTVPEASVTLRHHRLSRDASQRANSGSTPHPDMISISSPRRNSSGDSQETGQSDPKNWFDHSNQNPTATYDDIINTMDVDPPFFQRESDSSAEEKALGQPVVPKLMAPRSSSADDYRSVIDDLTVEIQKLKEELKRYKQLGPDMLRKDKLFEIKIHGLPARKKRELEATLRDFTASLGGSPDASSSQNKQNSRHNRNHNQMYSGSGSTSKHASSSSSSNIRPADSAYASMSTGAKSSGTSMGRQPTKMRPGSSDQKVEDYLRDIPEGLYPRHMIMTDKEKKKIVVRRLEQLFTGKHSSQKLPEKQPIAQDASLAPAAIERPLQAPSNSLHLPPNLQGEATREARILPTDQQASSGTKSRSADNHSASNSRGDQTESGGNGQSSGSGGTNTSPSMPPPPEQRPTRPRDLDPDRAQIPSENMDYIRHLGLVAPELLAEQCKVPHDVQPDAEGWVYLNLLCNMAQLHIINVTPDFVRSAVSAMSYKFQLSPDGRKIRWRGGAEGTKFSSDSSGYNSQKSPSAEDTDNSTSELRKRQKTGRSTGEGTKSGGGSSRNMAKFGLQVASSSESFHYKPMFVQQQSPYGQTSMDDTVSSFGPAEESNMGESKWGLSGSGASNRRKRRHDGAIIYYTGAPFCTDLSGDPGDVSPTTQMLSNSQAHQSEKQGGHSPPRRTASGSFINCRPLSEGRSLQRSGSSMDIDGMESPPCLTKDESDAINDVELDCVWSNEPQHVALQSLEPCGLGGVLPDDHFVVMVTTKRSKLDAHIPRRRGSLSMPEEATDSVIRRLATMSTSSPVLEARQIPAVLSVRASKVGFSYETGRVKRLAPASLPPPAIFFPQFSTDDSGDDEDGIDSGDSLESSSSEEFISRQANPHQSDDYPDGVDLSSGDEDGEDPDDSAGDHNLYDATGDNGGQVLPRRNRQAQRRPSSAAAAAGTAREDSKSVSAGPQPDGSSVATAGDAGSGYSSSSEESS